MGPNIDPCGTPALICFQLEFVLCKTTRCCREERYDENQVCSGPLIPMDNSLTNRPCARLDRKP